MGISKVCDTILYDAACACQWRNTRTSMSFSHPWSDYNLTTAMRDPMDVRDRLTTSPLGHVLPRFSKLPNQVLAVCAVKIDHCTVRHVSTERALESRADDLVSLIVILGSLEILGRTCPREVAHLVTLFYSNFYLLWLYCQSCFTTSLFCALEQTV